ncbi:unnamed protein product [Adineta ricciae]|uniref:MULE transposase domain-containing protein n=1 Tax=Adineta ricciae TaxID=249248 RepID=A0A815UVU6_ADIRI|nr:unnamed protein product [Adineta ricciae]
MLGYNGYLYVVGRRNKGRITFRCKKPPMRRNTVFSERTEHCHAPNIDQLLVIELKNKIKPQALISEESTSKLFYSELKYFPLDAAGQLPPTDALQKTDRRRRQTPKGRRDNRLPYPLKQTIRGENFILHEDNKLIIYTATSNFSVLKTFKHWFADETFKVCSDDFCQMFTLQGLFKAQVIQLVYGLLTGRSKSDYNQSFERIIEEDDFNRVSILTDFESGTIESIHSIFPNVVHKGCLFHFGQCVWRNIQSHGL